MSLTSVQIDERSAFRSILATIGLCKLDFGPRSRRASYSDALSVASLLYGGSGRGSCFGLGGLATLLHRRAICLVMRVCH